MGKSFTLLKVSILIYCDSNGPDHFSDILSEPLSFSIGLNDSGKVCSVSP